MKSIQPSLIVFNNVRIWHSEWIATGGSILPDGSVSTPFADRFPAHKLAAFWDVQFLFFQFRTGNNRLRLWVTRH
jgi:hypothetical protein